MKDGWLDMLGAWDSVDDGEVVVSVVAEFANGTDDGWLNVLEFWSAWMTAQEIFELVLWDSHSVRW